MTECIDRQRLAAQGVAIRILGEIVVTGHDFYDFAANTSTRTPLG